VSPNFETELRDALGHASESIVPRADLADRVRRAGRRRRHALTGTIALGLAAAVASGLIAAYGIAQGQHSPAANHHDHRHSGMHIVLGYDFPDMMAADGKWIYVAAGGGYPGEILRAYDRATGRLVRSIGIPAAPSTLQVGPGGLIWLAFFPDSNGGGMGVWLLSPDLAMRSRLTLAASRSHLAVPRDVRPTGEHTAIIDTDSGLASLRFPPPGQPGSAVLHWLPRVQGGGRIRGVPVDLAGFAGRIAVKFGNDTGQELISLAGSPPREFFPGSTQSFGPLAGSSEGLWTTLFGDGGRRSLGLIRLDKRLRLSTPRSIRGNPLFKRADRVITLGGVEWVILSRPLGSLACFTDRGGRIGPVTTLHLRPHPTRNTGIGSIATVGNSLYVLGQIGVASYPIPAACR
jgi:hypothetical protein